MLAKALSAATAAAAEKLYIEDVFSTWLYTGNGSTQTITNGIDLAGEGGLVWYKSRNNAVDNALFDTVRGAGKLLISNTTAAEGAGYAQSFTSSGFSLTNGGTFYNGNGYTYASWTFRKSPGFFDVVTYTGNGSTQTINHNLGSAPGCMIVKRTDSNSHWVVYHRSIASIHNNLLLNTTDSLSGNAIYSPLPWGATAPTSTQFSVGYNGGVVDNFQTNISGATYVAYLFAHDAGGFGDSGNDSVVSCGSMTNAAPVNLGWEPQFVLLKRTDSTGSWFLLDTMRGFDSSTTSAALFANLSVAEASAGYNWSLNATGFSGQAAGTYIYIAIRRGPMKTPTDATKVFQAKVYTGTNTDNRLVTTDIVTDMAWVRQRDDAVLGGMVVGDRMRGQPYLLTGATTNETDDDDSFDKEIVSLTEYGTAFSSMVGFWVGNDVTSKLNRSTVGNNHISYAFRRAPGFFDVVAYTGTGVARTVSHNLGVVPELLIVKKRNDIASWPFYSSNLGGTKYLSLNTNAAVGTSSVFWNDTDPTVSEFTVGTSGGTNANNDTYIAYLLATLPGVSKVGSYTGTGTTQQINCGFTAGARFVLIKRTDSTGSWYIWDSARGIISGNDPYLLLNSTAAEVTNTDYIDPYSPGFEISSTAPAEINANGGSYIFLAVA